MPISVQTAAQIRDTALALWAARYLARGRALSVVPDSDAYSQADAVALLVEGLEARLLGLADELFPDTASTPYLERHAAVVDLARKAASTARLSVTITGTPGAAYATTDLLVAADGTRYAPSAGGTLPGASTTIEVTAQAAGAAGNRAAGTTLAWQSTPVGINSTPAPVVSATVATGTDAETDAALAARVLRWWRLRPGAGNAADYLTWAEARPQVYEAFVYPLRHPSLGGTVYGAVTVVVLGPPGARVLSSGDAQDVKDYLVGTGAYAADGGQVPANVHPDDIHVTPVGSEVQDVVVAVTLGSGYSFPFTGVVLTDAACTTSFIELDGGIPTGLSVGEWIAVEDASVDGGYHLGRVVSLGVGGVNIDPAMDAAPPAGADVYPAPANWIAIRDAILAVFDALGPGPGTFPSERFPAENEGGPPAVLYQSALVGAAMGVPGLPGAPAGVGGVRAAAVTLVGALDPTQVPAEDAQILVPGYVRIVPA